MRCWRVGIVALPALPALLPALGRVRRAAAATASLVFASASLVHLSGGVTEAHFQFFVMVGVVALYQDWVPFGIALRDRRRCTTECSARCTPPTSTARRRPGAPVAVGAGSTPASSSPRASPISLRGGYNEQQGAAATR